MSPRLHPGRGVGIPALLAVLAFAAVLAVVAVRTPASSASFGTASDSAVTASADSESPDERGRRS